MATQRKSKNGTRGGSTLYGVLAGLLIGLVVAAAVAFYVTKAPMPFVDRATRQATTEKPNDPGPIPDPNQGLYGRDGAAGSLPTGPTATPAATLPNPADGKAADLDALIATLPTEPDKHSSTTAAPLIPIPAAPAAKAVKPPEKSEKARDKPALVTQTNSHYFLQAGAYRVLEDAETLKARILLLGLPVSVQRAEVNGIQINRVRVGPFPRLDDMNRARGRLSENKIESTVVKQQ